MSQKLWYIILWTTFLDTLYTFVCKYNIFSAYNMLKYFKMALAI